MIDPMRRSTARGRSIITIGTKSRRCCTDRFFVSRHARRSPYAHLSPPAASAARRSFLTTPFFFFSSRRRNRVRAFLYAVYLTFDPRFSLTALPSTTAPPPPALSCCTLLHWRRAAAASELRASWGSGRTAATGWRGENRSRRQRWGSTGSADVQADGAVRGEMFGWNILLEPPPPALCSGSPRRTSKLS